MDRFSAEQLESMFAEPDAWTQFQRFVSFLDTPDSSSSACVSKIALDYYFHNIVFCHEQNFTPDQTTAFHNIARSVFEASIERGELDLEGAFQLFTDKVLALAVVEEEDMRDGSAKVRPTHSDQRAGHVRGKGIESGVDRSQNGAQMESSELQPPGDNGGNVVRNAAVPPLFSVDDVAAITQIVARGLYRNFALYRTCFLKESRSRSERRLVQVETPLAPLPLAGADST